MLNNRWLVLAGTLASCVAAFVIVLAFIPAAPGVTRTNFHRVQTGMTQTEVEAILDGPPHDTAPNGRTWIFLRLA